MNPLYNTILDAIEAAHVVASEVDTRLNDGRGYPKPDEWHTIAREALARIAEEGGEATGRGTATYNALFGADGSILWDIEQSKRKALFETLLDAVIIIRGENETRRDVWRMIGIHGDRGRKLPSSSDPLAIVSMLALRGILVLEAARGVELLE